MEEEDAELVAEGVAEGGGLAGGGVERDGEVAGVRRAAISGGVGKLRTSVGLFLPRKARLRRLSSGRRRGGRRPGRGGRRRAGRG